MSVFSDFPCGLMYTLAYEDTNYNDSRPSVCQALLLLGLREYGIGCMSQGWLYVGKSRELSLSDKALTICIRYGMPYGGPSSFAPFSYILKSL